MSEFSAAPVKPVVDFDVLQSLDIRVGTIVEIMDLPKSRDVLKLVVNFGDHQRSILAGIKNERTDPKALTNVQALFVLNVPPKEMLGEVSQGMLFDLGYPDGITPALAVPEFEVPNGTRAG